MNPKLLEEKMELLRWVINLNDEQVIKNLINFKNEIFGVPFSTEPTINQQLVGAGSQGGFRNDPRQSPYYLQFGGMDEGFLSDFEEAFSLEEAKEQSIKKIQGWWRD